MNNILKTQWLKLSETRQHLEQATRNYKKAYENITTSISNDINKDESICRYDFDKYFIGGIDSIYPLPENLQEAENNYELLKKAILETGNSYPAIQTIKEQKMTPEELLAERKLIQEREKAYQKYLIKEKERQKNAPDLIYKEEFSFEEENVFYPNDSSYKENTFINMRIFGKNDKHEIQITLGDDCDNGTINLTPLQLQQVIQVLNKSLTIINERTPKKDLKENLESDFEYE